MKIAGGDFHEREGGRHGFEGRHLTASAARERVQHAIGSASRARREPRDIGAKPINCDKSVDVSASSPYNLFL